MSSRRYVEQIASAAIQVLHGGGWWGGGGQEAHMPLPSANKAEPTLTLNIQRSRRQKSKPGVSVAPQKRRMSSQFCFKNVTLVLFSGESGIGKTSSLAFIALKWAYGGGR